MLFSSIPFLYGFLPVVLLLYAVAPKGQKNPVLLISSLIFYLWGEPAYVLLMLLVILAGWLFGLLIERYRGTAGAKCAASASVVTSVALLGVFKYADFIIGTVNRLLGRSPAAGLLGLALPMGISFYIFQMISYTIDLYRGQAAVQRSFLKLAVYISLFPQLVAGPIVRYAEVAGALEGRRHTLADAAAGARRFVIGLGKKVLIANVMGALCTLSRSPAERTVLSAWLYAVAFALQIYFDFSGYSDMAIGLGRILGFHFPENFRYPYIAKTATDFWRRWHITLGSWFRDYVYIPLGGSRAGAVRHVLSILAVWLLTGLWHGAGWNFLAWGLFFGLVLLMEKYGLAAGLDRLPALAGHLYLLLVLLVGWVLFDASTLAGAMEQLRLMVGVGAQGWWDGQALYALGSYLVPLLVAVLGCTPLPGMLAARLAQGKGGARLAAVLQPLLLGGILLLVTAYLIDGSFNPFIYFRF